MLGTCFVYIFKEFYKEFLCIINIIILNFLSIKIVKVG